MNKQPKSVTALIDDILKLLYDCPANHTCRSRLAAIRDGMFLELPEDRQHLLNRVGAIINESVPSGETNCPIHKYWFEIRELWNEALRPKKGFLQS